MERMMKWFRSEHLPEHLADVVVPYRDLAEWISVEIPPGPERTVALRKLLESKDSAVRAVLEGDQNG